MRVRALFHLVGAAVVLTLTSTLPADASILASCNSTYTSCLVPADVLLQLPFIAIAGDAVLTGPKGTNATEVFRIFDNFIDTGAGTGLGNLAELYSTDNIAFPTNWSVNAVFLPEGLSGITTYTSGGTTYLLGVPEPSSLTLSGAVSVLLLLLARQRKLYGATK